MTNSELSLTQLAQVSGGVHGRDGCVDPMLLKLILSGQSLPGPLREEGKRLEKDLSGGL